MNVAETLRDQKYRLLSSTKRLAEICLAVERSLSKKTTLSPLDYQALVALSGSGNLETQLNALDDAEDFADAKLVAVWSEMARTSYHDFYEFMNRNEELPEGPDGEIRKGYIMSPHQNLIGDLLMAAEAKRTMRFMLSMPPGHCKAVADTTSVTMGDGSRKAIADIVVGDSVITHEHRACNVSGVHVQGDLGEWEIVTDTGRRITAENEHPFLTLHGWKRVDALSQRDVLAVVPFNNPRNQDRTDDEYALAGYLIGDGSVTQGNCSFTNADPEVWVDFERIINGLGMTLGPPHKKGKAQNRRLNNGGRAWVRASDIDGMNSHNKRVPSWVFQGSNQQISYFIGAYWACDGTVIPKGRSGRVTTGGTVRQDCGVELSSINVALIGDIQSLLGRMGIRSIKREHKGRDQNGRDYLHYRLRVGPEWSCANFHDQIVIPGEKQARLAEWAPIGVWPARYLAERIIAVRPTGRAVPMRCLTVDNDHSFLAEDVAVHNSTHSSHHFPAWYFGRNPGTNSFRLVTVRTSSRTSLAPRFGPSSTAKISAWCFRRSACVLTCVRRTIGV